MQPVNAVQTERGAPIVFRSTTSEVYEAAVARGSLWLRTANYYQDLEDRTRSDPLEGVNATTTNLPLRIDTHEAVNVNFLGGGSIGQAIAPHYLACFHGSAIVENERESFGGYTMGVRDFAKLAVDILYEASKQLRVLGYRYGQVNYSRTALTLSERPQGDPAIKLSANPPVYLHSINSDVLRKAPLPPMIYQDEWRIAVFSEGFLDEDPSLPLKIEVDPRNFYRYVEPTG